MQSVIKEESPIFSRATTGVKIEASEIPPPPGVFVCVSSCYLSLRRDEIEQWQTHVHGITKEKANGHRFTNY